MSQKQVIIQFKYKNNTYEIYEHPIDLTRIKDVIKKMIKFNGDIQLSWMRVPNSDYINIIDDNNLQRCFEKQINSQSQQNPFEYIINLKVTEDYASTSDQFNIKPSEKDLSKSTQLQYPIGQKFINSSQEAQFQNIQIIPPATDYDRSKYTDYTCYNCGGDSSQIQSDQKCQICQGVGKLLKTKEIETIEYLIEKKLCQLYPELKQIYKRFQQNGSQAEDVAPSSQAKSEYQQLQALNQLFQQPQQQQINQIAQANEGQQQENKSNDQKLPAAPEQQNQQEPGQQQLQDSKKAKSKNSKKKLQFDQLFSNPPNEQALTNNFGFTPSGEDQQTQVINKIQPDIIKQEIIPAINLLKGSDELFSFDVSKHPYDKNEIVFKQNEKQVLNFEIKRKSKQWPISKMFIEEVPEKYFDNLSEKKEFDFSANEEIQTIQLILKPLPNIQGTIISKWKLYYIDSNNERRSISGVIPLKAIIQNN
ncbi:hypothetical protein ABPG74_013333 [Tetrahymena malaccensis]